MKIKKHNWVKYGESNGTICEIKLLDELNRKLDFFRFNTLDKKAQRMVGSILKNSYGINLQKNNKEEEKIEIQKIIKEDLMK